MGGWMFRWSHRAQNWDFLCFLFEKCLAIFSEQSMADSQQVPERSKGDRLDYSRTSYSCDLLERFGDWTSHIWMVKWREITLLTMFFCGWNMLESKSFNPIQMGLRTDHPFSRAYPCLTHFRALHSIHMYPSSTAMLDHWAVNPIGPLQTMTLWFGCQGLWLCWDLDGKRASVETNPNQSPLILFMFQIRITSLSWGMPRISMIIHDTVTIVVRL